MNQEKYIGMDVHQATISVGVMDSKGQVPQVRARFLGANLGPIQRQHR